jgi:hypothetical protein
VANQSSLRAGEVAGKVKSYKPKNLAQATQNKALAISAIEKGVCLSLTYEGLPRVVEVHTVGTTTNFKPAMNAYQVDGESGMPPVTEWRMFLFDECFDVALSETESTAPRADFKKGAKLFRKIDKQV